MRSILKRLIAEGIRGWSEINDLRLGIKTGEGTTEFRSPRGGNRDDPQSAAAHGDSKYYQAANYSGIRRVIQRLELCPSDVFYDIGCGKGRVVCEVARRRLHGVVGVELQEELCSFARQNAASLRGRMSPIGILCADAASADISGGTVYFMYNPFGEATMRDVLINMEKSLRHKPRRIRVVYYNSVCRAVYDGCAWLKQIDEIQTLTGRKITFYESGNGKV